MRHDIAALRQLKENASWYLLLGLGLIALGTLALFYALTATIISVLYIGIMFIVAGLFEGVKSFKVNRLSNFFLHIFLSLLYMAAGIFIIVNPLENAVYLTLVLAIFFVISGVARMLFAITQHIPHKSWLFINGLLTLALGILVWQQWPYSGLWVLGAFLGIDMIITGWTWVWLSMMAKNLRIQS